MENKEQWMYLYEMYIKANSVGEFIEQLIKLEVIDWEKLMIINKEDGK